MCCAILTKLLLVRYAAMISKFDFWTYVVHIRLISSPQKNVTEAKQHVCAKFSVVDWTLCYCHVLHSLNLYLNKYVWSFFTSQCLRLQFLLLPRRLCFHPCLFVHWFVWLSPGPTGALASAQEGPTNGADPGIIFALWDRAFFKNIFKLVFQEITQGSLFLATVQ